MKIKERFRLINGYDEEHTCGECSYCQGFANNYPSNRAHYKCTKIGITGSAATDIRLKDKACKLFNPEEVKDGEI